MALGRHQEEFSILEAVDYLSSMAEIAPEANASKIINVNWLDPEKTIQNQEVVKKTFKVVHRYLEDLYEKNRPQLKEAETQRGVQAIMVLAKEAAQRLDKYTQLFKDIHGVSRLKEYLSLQHFYLNKIMQKFQEEAAPAAAAVEEPKNLEMARSDERYELFLIKNEERMPYFSQNLLSHIKLIGEADRLLSSTEGEDPFLRFQEAQDRDVYEGAIEILELARPHIEEFYKEGMHLKDKSFVSSINKAVMALMMTANLKNLMGTTSGKSCLSYYADFHFYLREALSSSAYIRLIALPPEPSDHFSHTLLNLAHALCCFFFFRVPRDKKTIEVIYKLIHKTEEKSAGPEMWDFFLQGDEELRQKLKQFPHGPMVKTLESLQRNDQGFDPMAQGNYPAQLFHFFQENRHLTVLRIPCPTKQLLIDRAEVTPEFKGLLRYFKESNVRYLLINLQDRTDPLGEQARSRALEELPQDSEFSGQLTVVTLPIDSEWVVDIQSTAEFLQAFKEQFFNSGFFFPERFNTAQLHEWSSNLLEQMHQLLFHSKEFPTVEQRMGFILLFYLFFVLKLVEILDCDSMSFTSKDGLDVGAAANASFFSFLRLMTDSRPWSEEEKEFVLWMFYYFPLMVRERPLHPDPFKWALSALAALHLKLQEDRSEFVARVSRLYSDFDFLKIKIQRS